MTEGPGSYSGPFVVGGPRRAVLAIIAAGTAMRLVLALVLGLGVDESYTVAVSRQLSWSYFDHPPLAFWITHVATALAGSEAALVVRLPFIVLFAGTTWLMYRLTARLFGDTAGILAALLLTISPVFSLSTGGWALPDGPLMFCSLAAAWALARATLGPDDALGGRWWVLAGIAAGGAMLSKYHGALLAIMMLVFVLTEPGARRRLRRGEPWLAMAIALALCAPVVIWNATHGWASFRFQAGRGTPHHGIHLGALAESVGGQAAYVLPWIWVPLLVVFVQALRRGPRDPARWLLACLGAGPIAAFTLITLGGNPGLPHWEAPGYLMLVPLLGAAVAARLERGERATRGWLTASTVAFATLVLLLGSQAATGWMGRVVPSLAGSGDPTAEMVSWAELEPAARALGVGEAGRFVATGNWIQAGKVAYALGPKVTTVCLCGEPHHFAFAAPLSSLAGRDALIVEAGRRNPARFAQWFRTIQPRGEVQVLRAGRPALVLELSVGRDFSGR